MHNVRHILKYQFETSHFYLVIIVYSMVTFYRVWEQCLRCLVGQFGRMRAWTCQNVGEEGHTNPRGYSEGRSWWPSRWPWRGANTNWGQPCSHTSTGSKRRRLGLPGKVRHSRQLRSLRIRRGLCYHTHKLLLIIFTQIINSKLMCTFHVIIKCNTYRILHIK